MLVKCTLNLPAKMSQIFMP